MPPLTSLDSQVRPAKNPQHVFSGLVSKKKGGVDRPSLLTLV
jgi:hypothetical protein